MPWINIGTFELTSEWQYTAPIAGRIFRVRHLNATGNNAGLIGQAFLEDGKLQLFDSKRLTPKPHYDLLDYPAPEGLSDRRIAVRLNDFSGLAWTVAIDVLSPTPELDENQLTALIQLHLAAHEADSNPHPGYATLATLEALATALDGKEDNGVASALLDAHVEAADPHTQYVKNDELNDVLTAYALKADQKIRQSHTLTFTTAQITNSTSFVDTALAIELPQPPLPGSKTRIRFDGFLGGSQPGAVINLTLKRNGQLLHPPGTVGLTRERITNSSDSLCHHFVFQESAVAQSYLIAFRTSAGTAYIGRSHGGDIIPTSLAIEEIL